MKLNKKIKFNNLKQFTIPVIVFALSILFITLLWLSLNLFGLTLGLITITSLTIIYTRQKNTTVPFLGKIIKQQYFNTRFKILNLVGVEKKTVKLKIRLFALKKYQKALFYFILVLKSSEEGYYVVKEDIFKGYKASNFEKIIEGRELVEALDVVERVKEGKEVNIKALEKLDALLLRLYKQRQKKVARLSASGVVLLVIVSVISSLATTFFSPQINQMYAATYGWVQNDWSGGADESALATHESSQTGWTKYFSKTDNVGVEDGKLTQLSAVSDAWVENSDTEYTDHGIMSGVYVKNNRIYAQKANGASCSTNDECIEVCIGSSCSNTWLTGDCTFDVYYAHYLGVYSSAVGACATLGGRVPTVAELNCLYANKSSYANNIGTSNYWSSTPLGTARYIISMLNGGSAVVYGSQSGVYYRCIK